MSEDDVSLDQEDDTQEVVRPTTERSRSSRAAAGQIRRGDRRQTRRLRRLAAIILVVTAVAIAIIGLQVKDSEFGYPSGRSAPFSLLPLESTVTYVTEPTTTSSTTTSSSTSTTTTTTTEPVAAVISR